MKYMNKCTHSQDYWQLLGNTTQLHACNMLTHLCTKGLGHTSGHRYTYIHTYTSELRDIMGQTLTYRQAQVLCRIFWGYRHTGIHEYMSVHTYMKGFGHQEMQTQSQKCTNTWKRGLGLARGTDMFVYRYTCAQMYAQWNWVTPGDTHVHTCTK